MHRNSDGTLLPAARVNRCPRCDGLLVYEPVQAVLTRLLADVHGWRCVNCGCYLDPIGTKNRWLQRLGLRQFSCP